MNTNSPTNLDRSANDDMYTSPPHQPDLFDDDPQHHLPRQPEITLN